MRLPSAAYLAHSRALILAAHRDATPEERLALEIDPSIADEIDALDDAPRCETCDGALSEDEITYGDGECRVCDEATWRERLSDEREER